MTASTVKRLAITSAERAGSRRLGAILGASDDLQRQARRWDAQHREHLKAGKLAKSRERAVVCCDCSTPFETASFTAKRCPACRPIASFKQRNKPGALAMRSRMALNRAVARGLLPKPSTLLCVDCGLPACDYDHRDYTKPLDVRADVPELQLTPRPRLSVQPRGPRRCVTACSSAALISCSAGRAVIRSG